MRMSKTMDRDNRDLILTAESPQKVVDRRVVNLTGYEDRFILG